MDEGDDGLGKLFERLAVEARSWARGESVETDGGLGLRFGSAPGMLSFVTVEAQPASPFSALGKVEVTTLVGAVDQVDEEVLAFLLEANGVTVGGSWEYFQSDRGTDLGVAGRLLIKDPSARWIPLVVTQLLALQLEGAQSLRMPSTVRPFTTGGGLPVLGAVVEPRRPNHPMIDLGHLAQRVWWRSASDTSQRWSIEFTDEEYVEFMAPQMVGAVLQNADGTTAEDVRKLTVTLTKHPTAGPGVLVQAGAVSEAETALRSWMQWSTMTQAAAWFGTGFGGLRLWHEDEGADGPAVVYRAFLPLDLLGVLDPPDAIDLVVDVALGACNVIGVAEHVASALDEVVEADEIPGVLASLGDYLVRNHRVAAHRAATRSRDLPDDAVDMSGPVVDVGAAVLDRLAVDQLAIHTAPFVTGDRSFSWLPGPHVQTVSATPMAASRRTEVTEVSVTTDLGAVPGSDRSAVARLAVELMDTLPLCSLVLDASGRLVMTSRVMLHEGVWWYRTELVAVLAALQLNCADQVASAMAAEHVSLDLRSELRTRLSAEGERGDLDEIYGVVPKLLTMGPQAGTPTIGDLITLAETRLLDQPQSRLFGDVAAEPDVVVAVSGLHPDGGWDPVLGEAMVNCDTFDHEIAGPCMRVRVHPGWVVEDDRRIDEALSLTDFTHGWGGVALVPSWVLCADSVGPAVVVPHLAVGLLGLDQGAEVGYQAARSCMQALGAATTYREGTFPEYDRSQVHLTRVRPQAAPAHRLPGVMTWAPMANMRAVMMRQPDATDAMWQCDYVDYQVAHSFRQWCSGEEASLLFDFSGDFVASRTGDGVLVRLGACERVFNDDELLALAAQLAEPEGPAAGTAGGTAVVGAIDWGVMDDGSGQVAWLTVPPAPAATIVLASAEGLISDVEPTTVSVLLGVRSPTHRVVVDLLPETVQTLLDTSEDGMARLCIRFPLIDSRVTDSPPSPRIVQTPAAHLEKAYRRLTGRGVE